MLEYILFDLDGTLTDSAEGITKSVDYALRQVVGIETDDLSTLKGYIGPPLTAGFMENHGLDEATALRCRDVYRSRYEKTGLFENKVYDGVPEMLETLHKAGRTLLVATSKPEIFARRILEHFNLAGYFSEIVGATMDGSIDAKDEVIAEALRRLHHPAPDRVLMVGDRHHDIDGARKNGLPVLGVLYGFGSAEEMQQADATAATPQEAAQIILNWR